MHYKILIKLMKKNIEFYQKIINKKKYNQFK